MNQILLAEDEEHIAKLIEFKLKKEGFSITIAKNGKQALELFHSAQDWKLLILDVMMPFMDGWQVLKEVRHSPFPSVPVLMLTAKSSETDIAKSAELGATRFLKKPFDPSELARVVRETLSEK
jgi:DNA-binding response OmpR family regulator